MIRNTYLASVLALVIIMAYFAIAMNTNTDKHLDKMKSIYEKGVDFCEWFGYYGATDPIRFCQTSQIGTTLIFTGSIGYILLWILIIIFAFYLFKFGRDL